VRAGYDKVTKPTFDALSLRHTESTTAREVKTFSLVRGSRRKAGERERKRGDVIKSRK
jgi:hypothetical protein